MKNKILKRIAIIASLSAVLIGLVIAINGILAYLTDIGPTLENNFTIALEPVHTIIEKFPFSPEAELASTLPELDMDTLEATYDKSVQVANIGYIDEYVRVKIEFQDSDLLSKTSFSNDKETFYDADPNGADPYKNHLPDGWVYNDADGWYYFTKMLYAGDFENFLKQFTYDKSQFRYFYKDPKNSTLITYDKNNIITNALINHVKTTFADARDMRSYGINIVAQSCPFYTGNDYKSAWQNYNVLDYM